MKSLSEVLDDVKNGIEDISEFINSEEFQNLLNKSNLKKIVTLLGGGQYLLGYSLLKYVVEQVENNSDNSQGWSLSGNTLTATGNIIDNLLLINSQNNSDVTTINASNVVNNLILVGNTLSNVINGSSGSSTLWGGGEGDNTITGGASRDQFWYAGGGNDIVTNFLTGMADNSDVAVLVGNTVSVVRSGKNIFINFGDGHSVNLQTDSATSDELIMYSADGENIFGAKIGDDSATNLTYSNCTDYFQLSQPGVLNVVDSEDNNIQLDGAIGTVYNNIIDIDASSSTGNNTLAGDSNSNQITAGSGNDSLWGGSGEDTLIGGEGDDMFFFGKTDGTDIVENASENDTVNLYDVNLEEITSAEISNNKISIGLGTGGTLQINGLENLSSKFLLADGSTWQYNYNSNAWQNE